MKYPFLSRRRRRWQMPLAVRVIRRPVVWWLMTAIVAVLVGTRVNALHEEARRSRDDWGSSTAVLVATEPIAPGERLEGRVAQQQWPTAVVPLSALATLEEDATAAGAIGVGEMIVADRVSGGEHGLSGRVPAGRSALAVTASLVPAGVTIGDRVDLAVSYPSRRDADTTVVASSAMVIDVAEEQLTVAVQPDEVAPTADAVGRGVITILVRSDDGEGEN